MLMLGLDAAFRLSSGVWGLGGLGSQGLGIRDVGMVPCLAFGSLNPKP